MKGFLAALNVEFIKAMKSKILWITIVFFVFIALMMAFLMLVAKHPEIAGNSTMLSAKASFISNASWPVYFGLLMQLMLILGVLGPGIVIIWIFGREYSDRVIKDILALPVSRFKIVSAKLLIGAAWSLLLLTILFVTGLLAGFAIKLDSWSVITFTETISKVTGCSLLAILLITPIAWITCASRGYLLPIGFLILLIILTQFIFVGLPGYTPYFPWAIPGLFSGIAGPGNPEPGAISYIILALTSLLGYAGTAAWWRYSDQH